MHIKNFTSGCAILLLLLLNSYSSLSQENYLPGYILQWNGDTLNGFIDYRNWVRNPGEISFKATLSDEKSEFTPARINCFSVSGKIYESAVLEIETSPVNMQFLLYDPGLHFKSDTAFLQVLFRGEKSLYYYVTSDEKDQFYIRQDTSFRLLIYKKYLVEEGDNGNIYIAENKDYTEQLKLYLNDCETINKKIENLKYEKNSLENLFIHYSKCTSKEFDFRRIDDEPRFEIGMLGGVSLTNLKLSGTGYDYLIEAGYDLSANFTLGMFFDFIRFRNKHKWSWCNELLLTRFKVEGQYYQYFDENNQTTTYTTLDFLYQKWNTMARYKFPAGKLFLFANAGISGGVLIGETNTMTREIKFYDMERTEDGTALNHVKYYELGFMAGLGTRFKKFSLETRFELGNGFSSDEDLSVITNRYYFLLGYRF